MTPTLASLTAEIAKLKGLLKEVEWARWNQFAQGFGCPFCLHLQTGGHSPDCPLAAAIQDAKEK